eukprot:2595059-Pyramimonas_sp.AAC.1
MPRNTLLASGMPWASWVSMVLLWRARRSRAKDQWISRGLNGGFLVEGFFCKEGKNHTDN